MSRSDTEVGGGFRVTVRFGRLQLWEAHLLVCYDNYIHSRIHVVIVVIVVFSVTATFPGLRITTSCSTRLQTT